MFPQGFAAVAERLKDFNGINLLADIGNGTMNVMYVIDCRPQVRKCYTEKYGTNQCALAVRENLMLSYRKRVLRGKPRSRPRNGVARVLPPQRTPVYHAPLC